MMINIVSNEGFFHFILRFRIDLWSFLKLTYNLHDSIDAGQLLEHLEWASHH